MSRNGDMGDKDKLALLDDLVIAEILATPDEEVLKGADPAGIAATRARAAAAKRLVGRQRMAEAKAAMAIERARPNVVPLDLTKGAAALRSLRAQDRGLDQKLTLAARSGRDGAEADQGGIEEDLAELAQWNDETPERGA